MKKLISVLNILIFLLIFYQSEGQIGGSKNFAFLNIPSNPAISALGGMNISKTQRDPNAFLQNPALLDTSKNNLLGFNFLPYLGGIKYSSVAFVKSFKKQAFGIAVQNIRYGEFQQTDATGNLLGKFSANDIAITLSHARKQGNITFGGNLKFVNSVIDNYTNSAILLDFGGVFKHPKHDLAYGIVVRNLGVVLKNFTPNDNPDLPLDVQIGLTFKPKYMPIRFSFTAHHLYKYDITYLDKTIVKKDLGGNIIENKVNTIDNLGRHFIAGAEFLLSKNFNILAGYNHLRNRELSHQNAGGFSGFSVGFLFKTKFIDFSYSYSGYNTAGNLNSFGLVCDLGKIIE